MGAGLPPRVIISAESLPPCRCGPPQRLYTLPIISVPGDKDSKLTLNKKTPEFV